MGEVPKGCMSQRDQGGLELIGTTRIVTFNRSYLSNFRKVALKKKTDHGQGMIRWDRDIDASLATNIKQ